MKGVFEILFKALSGDPDFEYAMIDGTIVRVHQHGARATPTPTLRETPASNARFRMD